LTLAWPVKSENSEGRSVTSSCASGFLARAADRQEPPGPGPGLPVGTIVAFAGGAGAVPEAEGWMLCDGRELPVSQYSNLHAAIGHAWGGSGNGSLFRLPDFRGRFLRGVNLGATGVGRDPDAATRESSAPGGNSGDDVGSLQDSGVGAHHHALAGLGDATGPGLAGEWLRFFGYKVPDDTSPVVTNFAAIHPGEGRETRPSNAAVHWIIRVR
jgi:microcystin-dependent protein